MVDKMNHVIPQFEWVQSTYEVKLLIDVASVKHLSVNIEKNEVHFECEGGKIEKCNYVLNLTLFKDIENENSKYTVLQNKVEIVLPKIDKTMWTNLTKRTVECISIKNSQPDLHDREIANHKIGRTDFSLEGWSCQITHERPYKEIENLQAGEVNINEKDVSLQCAEQMSINPQEGCSNIEEKETSKNLKDGNMVVLPIQQSETGRIEKKVETKPIEKEPTNSTYIKKDQAEKSSEIQEKVKDKKISESSSGTHLIEIVDGGQQLFHADNPAILKVFVKAGYIGIEDIIAHVETPSKTVLSAYVVSTTIQRTFSIKFLPTEIGTHKVKVFAKEDALTFSIEVYDTKRIKIDKNDSHGTVEKYFTFSVNVSEAGKGNLEVFANIKETSSRKIKCKIEKKTDDIYQVSFLPHQCGNYEVTIWYNGRKLKNTFWVEIFSPISASFFPAQKYISSYEACAVTFKVNPIHMVFSSDFKLYIIVEGPSGKIAFGVKILLPYVYKILFNPSERGKYIITVKVNGSHISGSPYEVIAMHTRQTSSSKNSILFINEFFQSLLSDNSLVNLEKVYARKRASFLIETSGIRNEGKIKLRIIIRDPQKEEIPVKVIGLGCNISVDFIPKIRGNHSFEVYYCDEPIKGSPFIVTVY